jgi:ubiquinone/menaquinone biosynthesis C-methylase UbiE
MYNKELFRGTAWYYAKYRRGYPNTFIEYVLKSFNLDKNSRVLDLGTGTGQIAIPISKYVKEVVAVDPEQEMLDEGKKQAENKRVANIKWVLSRAEDIMEELGIFDITTMGASFHWLEQDKVLEKIYKITEKGGGIVVVANQLSIFTEKKTEAYKEVVREVVKKYLGEKRRAGNSFFQPPKDRFEDVIKRSKFHGFQTFNQEYKQSWTIDEIIGFLYSTSFASRRLFGDKIDEFENELRDKLLQMNPDGQFTERVVCEAYLAWK